MKYTMIKKIVTLVIIVVLIISYITFDVGQYLTLENLKSHQFEFIRFYNKNPFYVMGVFFGLYIAVTAISLPGVAILTLAGGAIFGAGLGTILVALAGALGASVTFLLSRFLLKKYLQKRHSHNLAVINDGLRKDGAFYLFTMRLIPVYPFYLINLLMGLAPISAAQFFLVSFLGMLPGALVYVNAGSQIAGIKTFLGIFSPGVLFSLILLGLFPLIAKKIVEHLKVRKYQKQYFKPRKFDYNLVVIGGGPAGIVSATVAASVNAKVAIIEKDKMGGDSLNTGSVPNRVLMRSAKLLYAINHVTEFGVKRARVDFDLNSLMDRVQHTIHQMEPQVASSRISELGVECIKGSARIITPFEVRVNGRSLITQNILIATGSKPSAPDIDGLEMVDYLTSETIWKLQSLPKKLLILGAGSTGCELAQNYRRLGSQVILVERNTSIMSNEDSDVTALILEKFKQDGIHVLLEHEAIRVIAETQRKLLICRHNDKNIAIEFDEIVIATGRKPNISGFGVEDLNIHTTVDDAIEVDDYLRTNFPNILACGDVIGQARQAHIASYQAWHAAINALFQPFKKYRINYTAIPTAIYTDPEIARVGINELDAKKSKINYDTTLYTLDKFDPAQINGTQKGFIKVLSVPGTDTILGATIVSAHASDMIAEFVTAMTHGIGLHGIFKTVHIYPSFMEANQQVAKIWKSSRRLGLATKFFRWFHQWRRLRGTQQAKLQ